MIAYGAFEVFVWVYKLTIAPKGDLQNTQIKYDEEACYCDIEDLGLLNEACMTYSFKQKERTDLFSQRETF